MARKAHQRSRFTVNDTSLHWDTTQIGYKTRPITILLEEKGIPGCFVSLVH